MKKILGFLASAVLGIGVLVPAQGSFASDAAGIKDAVADSKNGEGFSYAVIGDEFSLSSELRSSLASEACFSDEWSTCSNGEAVDKESFIESESGYVDEGSEVLELLSDPRSGWLRQGSAHAITVSRSDKDAWVGAMNHVESLSVDLALITNIESKSFGQDDVRCDNYSGVTRTVNNLRAQGTGVIALSGLSGDAFGTSFPACVTGIQAVSPLDPNGLVGGYSVDESVVSVATNFGGVNSIDASRGMAKIAAIYSGLWTLGTSVPLLYESLNFPSYNVDDVVVKNIPVVEYESSRNFLSEAVPLASSLVPELVQVIDGNSGFVALPDSLSGEETYIDSVHTLDANTGNWKETSFQRSGRYLLLDQLQPNGSIKIVYEADGNTYSTRPISIRGKDETPIGELTSLRDGVVYSPALSLNSSFPRVLDENLQHTGLQFVRDAGLTGRGVTVAIIDDGLELDHPYIDEANVIDAMCLMMDNSCADGSNRQFGVESAQPAPVSEGEWPDDHGTMVAGTIGGKPTQDATGGIVPDVNFLIARVDLNGSDEQGDFVEQALDWVIEKSSELNIAAVNMSFGSPQYSRDQVREGCEPRYEEQFAQLRNLGIAPVVAAGNDGQYEAVGSPACEVGAIAVGATYGDDQITGYSNISEHIAIMAPAEMMTSFTNGSYGPGSGTSNAAPVIAGAFAVAKQISPDLTIDEVLYAMRETGVPIDDRLVTDLPRIDFQAFLGYLTSESQVNPLRPAIAASFVTSSFGCEATPTGASESGILRYKTAGEGTWRQVSGVSETITIENLLPSKEYVFTYGVPVEGSTYIWADRVSCFTPEATSATASEHKVVFTTASGNLVHLTDLALNGSELLSVVASNGTVSDSVEVISGEFVFIPGTFTSGASLQIVSSEGSTLYADLVLPAASGKTASSAAPDPRQLSLRAYSSESAVSMDSGQMQQITRFASSLAESPTKVICTGVRLEGQPMSKNILVRKRAKEVCEFATSLVDDSPSVWFQTKETKAPSYNGRVIVVMKFDR